jgi:LacI family transcriptional regulator
LNRPERARGATLVDVAQLAGVSRMTVSRVINEDARVREPTRLAVQAAIRELNYQPNLTARSLVMAGELRIGVIYSNPSAAFMSDFLVGVFEEASNAGARLVLLRGENGQPPAPHELQRLLAAGVQGVVLAPPLGECVVVREVLRTANLPVAVVAAGRPPTDAINVRIDDRQASQAMARHLLDLGHRRIGFIAGNPDQAASAERLEGARAAVAEVGGLNWSWPEARSPTVRDWSPPSSCWTSIRRPPRSSPAMTTWPPPPCRWPTAAISKCRPT